MDKNLVLVALLGLVLLWPGFTFSTLIHVPDNRPTIQAGIDACSLGDTVMVADGTYTGGGNRDIDFGGKSIVLMSENGPEVTVIDCEGNSSEQHRGFYFHSGEDSTAVVDGFTIQGGYGPFDYQGISVGSGIKCDSSSSPTIRSCVIYKNELRAYGGGMYCENSSPIVLNCFFIDNKSYTYNSGIGRGAGLYCNNSDISLTGCTFTGNIATVILGDGGGVYCTSSNPILNNCTFIGNSAGGVGGRGGGLYSYLSSPILSDCLFSGNGAEYGGGMHSWGDTAILTGCIFSKNNAWYDTNDGGWGGGFNCWGSYVVLTNCTFSGNSANQYMGGYGGAINIKGSSVTLENCIVAFTLPGSEPIDCYDSIPNLLCCDIYGNAGGDWVGCIADQAASNGNFSLDPRFCDTANDDYHIFDDSPCSPDHPDNSCGVLIGALEAGCNTTDVSVADNKLTPESFSLSQNHPNPFNPATAIDYSLQRRLRVRIAVYDLLGRKIKTLANAVMPAGAHTTYWDGTDEFGRQVASGVYLYRITCGEHIEAKKMILLR
jgi:hypothetical protein